MTKISDKIKSLPSHDKELLDLQISVIQIKKGEFAFNQSAFDSSIYYVVNGLLRKYLLKNGNEKTIDFYFKDELYFPHVLTKNKTTNCFLQAIEKTTIFKLNIWEFEKLKKANLKLLELENLILDLALTQSAERLQNFQIMSATERYVNLLEKNPEIVQNIPLIYVASYLGINNASLSKIRANLK